MYMPKLSMTDNNIFSIDSAKNNCFRMNFFNYAIIKLLIMKAY